MDLPRQGFGPTMVVNRVALLLRDLHRTGVRQEPLLPATQPWLVSWIQPSWLRNDIVIGGLQNYNQRSD